MPKLLSESERAAARRYEAEQPGLNLKGKAQGESGRSAEEDWLWLCALPGLYRKEKMVLLRYYQSPGAVRANLSRDIGRWKREEKGNWADRAEKTLRRGDAFLEETRRRMEKSGTRFISRDHHAYPALLQEIADPPYGLFYRGHLPPAKRLKAAVVGARACTEYGAFMAEEIASAMASRGIAVISGMASGIDGIAQQAALDAGGESFAVLGSGCDICYPRENISLFEALSSQGGIISEFPCGTGALPIHFPMRNRIISGLCDVLVVTEARKKSGSLITADLALDQGREVYAVPGRSTDPLSYGCNRLIGQGAGVILDTRVFLETLSEQFPDYFEEDQEGEPLIFHPEAGLAPSDELVYSNVDSAPVSLEELARRTQLPVRTVGAAMTNLVLEGLAAETAGGKYRRLP